MGDHSTRRSQDEPVRPGVYKHYKHHRNDPKYYLVLAVIPEHDTGQLFVDYVCLYPVDGSQRRLRRIEEFTETVTIDGALMPRYEYIGTQIPPHSF